MFSLVLWTFVLIFFLHKTNEVLGKIDSKLSIIHGVLLWFVLISFMTTPRMIGWAIRHYQNIEKYFYKQVGIFPDWFNLSMWFLNIVTGLIFIYLVILMAKREEKARKIFISLLPLFFITTAYEIMKGFYSTEETYPSDYYAIGSSLLVALIPSLILFFFYSKDSVKKLIFTET